MMVRFKKPFTVHAVKRVAVIGALAGAGMPLMVAGRLVAVVRKMDFNQADGEIPAGYNNLARELEAKGHWPATWPQDDFSLHKELLKHPKIYTPGKALSYDAVLEVINKQLVYVGSAGFGSETPPDGNVRDPRFSGRIEGWARDSAMRFVSGAEFIVCDPADPKYEEDQRKLISLVEDVRPNALAKIVVNASLAIRTGFDRLAEYQANHRDGRRKRTQQ